MNTRHLILLLLSATLALADPNASADHLLSTSRAAAAGGDLKQAVEAAEAAAAAAPERADVHAHLGMMYSRRIGQLNMMQQAMAAGRMKAAFERAIQLNPDEISARIGLVRYYANAPAIAGGSPERAHAEALEVQKRNPFLGACELGWLAARQGNLPEALRHYEAAAQLQPDQARVQVELGRLHQRQGDSTAARNHFARALTLQPGHPGATQAMEQLAAAAAAP
jgi:tetratricopeptide (TPR) repeat protein